MSELYAMHYLGEAGVGSGAICIGNGSILGVDATDVRYNGTYTEERGRVRVTAMLSAPPGGAILVTGESIFPGESIPLTADWPMNFTDGSVQEIHVMGNTVHVTFEKIGEIP